MVDVLKAEIGKETTQQSNELPPTQQKKTNNTLLRNKEKVMSEPSEVLSTSRAANESPNLRQISNQSPSQNVVVLSSEMAQQTLN